MVNMELRVCEEKLPQGVFKDDTWSMDVPAGLCFWELMGSYVGLGGSGVSWKGSRL